MKRVVTALLLIPFFCYIILWAPQWAFLVTVAAVAVLCFREYSELAALHGIAKPGLFGYAAGLLLLLLPGKDEAFFVLVAILGMALALRSREMARALPDAAALLLGVVYVFGSLRCAVELRAINPYWVFFALSLNWAGDIAAFYVGRLLGRHKLAPNVSPGKSWEGSIASTAASVVYAAFYFPWLLKLTPLAEALAMTVIANVAGQFGDLCESAMKRGAGVKDSGNLLPGHGGWLDRVDSSLFAVPVVYFVVSNFGW
ncbi:MAG TPA: phosphatidate cytidylyltransferase [Bryobacteraceae bacterium]|jgi:phosphatidate cytidylyltransferase|nr:phosphatidate cytidylyltransferase [Bryobacteraceae bacterium]